MCGDFLVQPAHIKRGAKQLADVLQRILPTVGQRRSSKTVKLARGLRRPMKELHHRFAVQEVREKMLH